MRSHVAVYRAPETAAPQPPPLNYAPLRYHQHPLSHWPGSQQQQAPAYRLHHGPPSVPQSNWAASSTVQPPQPGGYGVVNQQRINECAGIPLISNASSHLSPAQRQRLLRKSAPKSCPTWPPGGATMSQLAVHAQGMPLLQQNGKQHIQQQQQQSQQLQHHQTHHHHHHPVTTNWSSYQPMSNQAGFKLAEKSRALRYQNSAPPVLSSQEKPVSNASSQDQGTSPADTCLPRIIKPRKRRKKDRKPGNCVLLKMESEMQPKITNPGDGYPAGGGSYHLPPGILQHDHTHGVCFCRECDPLRSLWDYPLRRSLSDASSSEQGGGSRNSSSSTSSTHSDSSCDSSICSQSLPSSSILQEETTEEFAPITGDSSRAEIVGVIGSQRSHPSAVTTPSQCLSDDSGYGDILSGINIANDLFGNCFRGGKLGNASSSISAQAETLLNESLNEISRKLIETCNAADHAGSGSGATSDSGLDSAGSHNCGSGLVFNFEHLNLTDATPTALDFLVDCNNNSSSSSSNSNSLGLMWRGGRQTSGGGSHDDSQVAAAKLGPDSRATPTRLILGTVGKLKPAFSTIS
ncbi:uncharacterized protein LOC108116588 [Drosophila eugracilis]|uniref:uncharacterized protein LOC108116588 n=1 Tax=Drosophila eugracilis TaxID=29029 RepID=UPI0007E808EE|nr:uncharacterized protein LOC108116588 [Drosophila eugracilis]